MPKAHAVNAVTRGSVLGCKGSANCDKIVSYMLMRHLSHARLSTYCLRKATAAEVWCTKKTLTDYVDYGTHYQNERADLTYISVN